jgi:hypothetical protein
MFDPPPGYVDMLGDAETAAYSELYETLVVTDVGVLTARRPRPNAIAALAMSATPSQLDTSRADFIVMFVTNHLHPDELERVYVAMMIGNAPSDSIDRIARAIATWGTARPYLAVVTLAVMTAHHWRTLRLKFVQSGVPDPMRLTTMHILLDATESAVLEAMASSGDRDSEMKRTMFIDQLYSPLADQPYETPRGFTDDDTEDAFDAFAAAAR